MDAVDVLEVPLSRNNNRYLLVIQEYFTKWAEAIPMPDQTANQITAYQIILNIWYFTFWSRSKFRKYNIGTGIGSVWS